jgi:ATP-binding cassette, subfamily F, member 3
MPILALQKVRKTYDGDVLFEDVDFAVERGDRVGVVGPNGAGKTTVFRLLLGTEAPDGGEVVRERDLVVGHLPQQPELDPARTVFEETLSAADHVRSAEARLRELEAEMERTHDADLASALADDYGRVLERFRRDGGFTLEARTATILSGLGVREDMYGRLCGVLSGGERSRVGLAKLLLRAPDVMLLDEPTNHLDLSGVEWLEEFLRVEAGTFVVVSHDRFFLDRTTTKTIEILDGGARTYPAPYSGYEVLKAEQTKALLREIEKQKDYVEKERTFIRRHMGSQRSREAKGRLKRLERVEMIAPPPADAPEIRFSFEPARPQGTLPFSVRGLAVGAGDKSLFRDLSFELLPGDRLGVVGPNGSGKSTLLKTLAGILKPRDGRVDYGRNVDVGYFDQEHRILDLSKTVYATLHDRRPRWTDYEVRSYLARFNFYSDDVGREASTLSGGERGRLAIACLLLERPNVLFLDEPTNHLDIPSRSALEDVLRAFTGTLIVVSHDRWFLERSVSKTLWIEGDAVELFWSSYSEAAAMRRARRVAAMKANEERRNAEAEAAKKKIAAETARAADKRKKRRSLAAVEADIIAREEERASLEAKLADPSIYGDGAAVKAVKERLDVVADELSALEAEWSEFA